MLKGKAEVDNALKRLYARTWAEEAASCSTQEWPAKVALGTCTKRELEEGFSGVCAQADELKDMAASLHLDVEYATRQAGGTRQILPTHFVVGSIERLSAAVGEKAGFARACQRGQRLRADFPHLPADEVAQLLQKMDRAVPEEVDFDLACRAGAWFAHNDAAGLTARQVPLEGFHAKWLDAQGRRSVVAQLAGLEALPLRERPAQVRFTYLDPDYLSQGGRRFDSWVSGDAFSLPYSPDVVVICENRDSALWFPPVRHGIAIMGDGFAGIENVAPLEWVRNAPAVIYWGDMDAAGFEIINGYRLRGLGCKSMLMDAEAFRRYECFGTRVDKNGREIQPKVPLDLPGLNSSERELYLRLVSPDWQGPRRIEQERIPLEDALCAMAGIVFSSFAMSSPFSSALALADMAFDGRAAAPLRSPTAASGAS